MNASKNLDETSPALSLDEYRGRVSALPIPTDVQIAAFVEYVCGAHSWYKHLPFWPPGAPLQFYLDPAAGMEMIVANDGEVGARIREVPSLHYSWLPTDEHRDRFGHLAFSRTSGTQVSLVAPDGTSRIGSGDSSAIFDLATRRMMRLPVELMAAGRVFVTVVIHPLGTSSPPIGSIQPPKDYRWPEESGGQAVLDQLRKYVWPPVSEWVTRHINGKPRRIGIRPSHEIPPSMPPIEELLEPERLRQRAAMANAARRTIEIAEIPLSR